MVVIMAEIAPRVIATLVPVSAQMETLEMAAMVAVTAGHITAAIMSAWVFRVIRVLLTGNVFQAIAVFSMAVKATFGAIADMVTTDMAVNAIQVIAILIMVNAQMEPPVHRVVLTLTAGQAVVIIITISNVSADFPELAACLAMIVVRVFVLIISAYNLVGSQVLAHYIIATLTTIFVHLAILEKAAIPSMIANQVAAPITFVFASKGPIAR